MRTLIIIAGGFALSAICLGIAKMIGGAGPSEMTSATVVFVILWLAAAASRYVGRRVSSGLLVPRGNSNFSPYISAARRGCRAFEMEILLKQKTVIDARTSDATRFVIKAVEGLIVGDDQE